MANILKDLRKAKKETQKEIAKNLGLVQQHYQRYETVEISSISNAMLLKFAEYFGVSVDYLLGREKIEFKSERKCVRVPVFGSIPAGVPIEVLEDDIIEEEEITEEMAKSGTYFCLRVSGDSMTPVILNKDIALIRKQDDCETNEIVAVHINGDGATLKKIRKEEKGLRLIPLNETYKPMFFAWKDVEELPVKIIGKLVEIRRKF